MSAVPGPSVNVNFLPASSKLSLREVGLGYGKRILIFLMWTDLCDDYRRVSLGEVKQCVVEQKKICQRAFPSEK